MSNKFINNQTTYRAYINDIKHFKSLTKEEEFALRDKIILGDEKAKKELYERHLKFVVSVAKEMTSEKEDLMEHICEGNAGLLHALGLLDFNRDIRLMTYAIFWIKNYINASKKSSEVIKKPVKIENTKVTETFDNVDYNTGDTDFELDHFELERPKSEYEKVTDLLFVLTPREREIINRYYGLDNCESENLTEIGKELGLTRERVRQIKFMALRKIRMNA